MGTCIFCQVPLNKSNRSEEHIIATWLQKSRNITNEILTYGFGEGASLVVTDKAKMHRFLAPNVCKPCNTGWMSRLENQNKLTITRLIDQQIEPSLLNDDERLQLAKWTIKTAIAMNSIIDDAPPIDRDFINKFDKGRSQNLGRCGVFAGRMSIPSRFTYIRTSHTDEMLVGGDHDIEPRIGIYIDGLVLITAFVQKHLGYTFKLLQAFHEPLWPNRGHELRQNSPLDLTGHQTDLKIIMDAVEVSYSMAKG
jgi:hypothetical protein